MLQHIVLHLARGPDFPEGSVERGYEIVAPLDESGHLDAEEWRKHKAQCRVRRFWGDEGERRGALVHHAGGANGATWKIHYADQVSTDDDSGFNLDAHRFAENEYVSIRGEGGRPHTFRVERVWPPMRTK